MLLGRASILARNTTKSLVRYGSHGGVPGENLPFSLENRYRLTAYFVMFFGSGIGAPYFILRHNLLKKKQ